MKDIFDWRIYYAAIIALISLSIWAFVSNSNKEEDCLNRACEVGEPVYTSHSEPHCFCVEIPK